MEWPSCYVHENTRLKEQTVERRRRRVAAFNRFDSITRSLINSQQQVLRLHYDGVVYAGYNVYYNAINEQTLTRVKCLPLLICPHPEPTAGASPSLVGTHHGTR